MAKDVLATDWIEAMQAARHNLRGAAQNYNLADPEVEPVLFRELMTAATELSQVILKAQIAAGIDIEEIAARAEEAAVRALQGDWGRSGIGEQWVGFNPFGAAGRSEGSELRSH
jgi:hypothetical protein